jgi:hypothetical protein
MRCACIAKRLLPRIIGASMSKSKSNDVSTRDPQVRELRDDELQEVSGGGLVLPILIQDQLRIARSVDTQFDVLVSC